MNYPNLHKLNADYGKIILRESENFSPAEQNLLNEILDKFEFNPIHAQALVQATAQQARFDPNALHLADEEDEDTTGICPHCLNPPIPPLRDYLMWREMGN